MKKLSTNGVANARKLKLARETLRLLSAADLEVAGGTDTNTADTCRTCPPCVTTVL